MSLASDLQNWNKDTRKRLVKSYDDKGFRASGNWERKLEPSQSITPSTVIVRMYGAGYTGAMTDGRKPGGMPPISKIEQWIKDKPADRNPWAVAKTIAALGSLQYRSPNPIKKRLITDALTDESIKELLGIVGKSIITEVRLSSTKILSK